MFRKVLEECAALVREFAGWSLLEELRLPEGVSRLQRTQFAQPALLAVEVALARLWNSWGIHPRVVIGHSAGEVAAAHISGALELSEAIRLVVHRGRVMERATGLGKMAVVHLPAALVVETSSPYAGRVSAAAMNSPESTVISGEPAAVEELVSKFRQNSVGTRMMPVDYAFHSPSMLPLSRELVEVLGSVSSRPQTVPMISTVSGKTVSSEELDVRYWADNVRQPVLFRAAIESAMASGMRTFVEVGPHPVLLTAIGECLEGAATAPLSDFVTPAQCRGTRGAFVFVGQASRCGTFRELACSLPEDRRRSFVAGLSLPTAEVLDCSFTKIWSRILLRTTCTRCSEPSCGRLRCAGACLRCN